MEIIFLRLQSPLRKCGHALQRAAAYPWLMMRSKLVPAVQVSSFLVQWILLFGIIMINRFPQLLLAGIILFALTTLFTLIITNHQEYPKAKDALKWAATTYVVAALASFVTLVQYILIYSGRRNN
jgi:Zn-dependent membrane protease YugP